MKARIIQRIIDAIRKSDAICVVGHVRPDGDCIGSQLALTLALINVGKCVACWNPDAIPGKLAFLDPDRLLQAPSALKNFDCVIAMDCATVERLGASGDNIRQRECLINIDHHESNTLYGDLNWVCAQASSTGELVFHLIEAAGWPITPPIADCLFTAISTDTGSFQYPSTRPGTYQIAGTLVERGANLARISHQVYQSYPLSRVRLLRRVYNQFRLTCDNQIAYFWLKQSDYQRSGAGPEDAEGLIDHLRAIEPVVVACLFEEVAPNLTRISLRSKDERVNVSDIAAQFGGGGHPAAAGAQMEGKAMSVQRRVIGAIRRALEAAA